MEEKRQKIIIALLIINAVLVSYFGITIKNQFNDINILYNRLSNIDNTIYQLEERITNRIALVLEEQDNRVRNVNYSYMNIDTDKKKAVLDFTVDFKNVKPNSRIYLSYRADGVKDRKEVDLDRIEGLTYGVTVELNLDKNYTYDFIERLNDGGETLLNVHPRNLYLYDEFYKNRVFINSTGSGFNDESLEKTFDFSINDFGIDKFKIEKVLLEIWYDGDLKDSLDISDKIIEVNNSDLSARYNMAVASGQIDSTVTIEEFDKTIRDYEMQNESGRKHYLYIHEIVFDTDYPEWDLNRKKIENLHFNLVITFKDGYIYNYMEK